MFKKKVQPIVETKLANPSTEILPTKIEEKKTNNFNNSNPITQTSLLNKNSTKIKKPKPQWDTRYNLIEVQYPKEIGNEKFKKRFKVSLTYKNNENKIKSKTVRFGRKDVKEFVDDSDPSKKNKICGKLGNTHNLFHGNFWRLHLLNGPSNSIKENYMNLINKIN